MERDARHVPAGDSPDDGATREDLSIARLIDAVDASLRDGEWPRAGPASASGAAQERAARAALREAIREYVGRMKARGFPPERILASVKEIVRRRMPRWLPQTATAVNEHLVRWCIAAYYDDAGARAAAGGADGLSRPAVPETGPPPPR